MNSASSTIAAIASGQVNAGVGVIRVSGPSAWSAVASVVTRPSPPRPRHATRVTVMLDGRPVDEGLLLWFEGPKSFTGEDVAELHCHGSLELLLMILRALTAHPGVRLAEAGEFTRRAFLNGKIDLSQAEAVGWLVSAKSAEEVRAAAKQMQGGLGDALQDVWGEAVALKADVEGHLDFPEASEDGWADFGARSAALASKAAELLEAVDRGALLRREPRVVLYGPVNAGKSSLFNRLVGAQRALVDDEAGTTRDLLESTVERYGVRLTWVDTAGLRESAGRVEQLGIELTKQATAQADLGVLVIPPEVSEGVLSWCRSLVPNERRVEVRSKSDALVRPSPFHVEQQLSALTGEGVDAFERVVCERLRVAYSGPVFSASERQRALLVELNEHASLAAEAAQKDVLEAMAGALGAALLTLASANGQDADAAVLDAVFRRFCIGK
jgi:tRNA modification GTPase